MKALLVVVFAAFLDALPVNTPDGIELTKTGKLRIGVNGDTLFLTAKGDCEERLSLWYPVTQVDDASRDLNGPPNHCAFDSGTGSRIPVGPSKCPLKLDEDGTMEIIVKRLPSDCTIALKNAFVPSKDEDDGSSGFPYVAVFVPAGIVLLLIGLALVIFFLAWPCWKRRRSAARASQAPAAPTPDPSTPVQPISSAPASVSSVVPQPSTTTIAHSDVPEAKTKAKTPAVKTPAAKTSAPPTTTTPASAQSVGNLPEKKSSAVKSGAPKSAAPTQSDTIADVSEKKKMNGKTFTVEAPVAPTLVSPKTAVAPSPTPTTAVAVAKGDAAEQKAPTTMDETLEEAPKKEAVSRRPPARDDKKGHLSADRIFESFEDVRGRGSKLTLPVTPTRSDAMEEKRMVMETAVESMVRHGIVDKYKEQDMILSRSSHGTEPREFLRMRKWYHDGVARKVDEREKRLLVSLVSAQFKLMEELRSEAEWRLAIVGADFPVDGSRATYTQRTRDYSMKPSTPAFIQMFALVSEYGCDIPLQGKVDLNQLFSEYSVQLLFCIALHRHFSKTTRRKALAHLSRKIRALLATYSMEEFAMMPYPLRLLPEALKTNPDFFDRNAQVQTDSGRDVKLPRKKGCRKKAAPKPAGPKRTQQPPASQDDNKPACPKPRSRTSKEDGKKSGSRTSAELSRQSADSKQEK